MNSSKVISVVLFLFSLGAIKETIRIFTSGDADIVSNRPSLMIMSSIFTLILLFFALKLWLKGTREK